MRALGCALMLLGSLGSIPLATSAQPRDPKPAEASAARSPAPLIPLNPSTWVDHDARPIRKPAERDPNLIAHHYREGFIEQLSQAFDIPDRIIDLLGPAGVDPNRPAANVNAFDEVPTSSWFTGRNHLRAVAPAMIRQGPEHGARPTPPWTIVKGKTGGITPGFQIKDSEDRRWLIKLDPPGYAQLGSGAGTVSSRLIWAAGYNFSQDEAVTFRREDLQIDEEVRRGKEGEKPFVEEDLEQILALGARVPDGRYYAQATLFLSGKPVGPLAFRGKRRDDPNDWYRHEHRRELRGLFVLFSWLNYWDVKDHQSIDMFHAPEGSDEKDEAREGHLVHNLLDAGATLGAAGLGPKRPPTGYEQRVDLGWVATRLVTLGFVVEPWRKAPQETGIPSVGNFDAAGFDPPRWRPYQFMTPFREMNDADAYWGAKLVASFANAQIAAAIDAAGYEDPRARSYLQRVLQERRDRIARYWFGRVAPLDFFEVRAGCIKFRDLAVDLGIAPERSYEVEIAPSEGQRARLVRLSAPELTLDSLGDRDGAYRLTLSVSGSKAKAARVELVRRGAVWTIARVRHG